jgi:hypothetical protein
MDVPLDECAPALHERRRLQSIYWPVFQWQIVLLSWHTTVLTQDGQKSREINEMVPSLFFSCKPQSWSLPGAYRQIFSSPWQQNSNLNVLLLGGLGFSLSSFFCLPSLLRIWLRLLWVVWGQGVSSKLVRLGQFCPFPTPQVRGGRESWGCSLASVEERRRGRRENRSIEEKDSQWPKGTAGLEKKHQ